VQTALGMREALARLNARRTPQLQMRVSVNSGRALVGDIGAPSRREFTVLGDVVNTAARMQAELCAPGQILISGATYGQVQQVVQATPLGSAVVKGRSAAIVIYGI
jgi:adenylate cyclase